MCRLPRLTGSRSSAQAAINTSLPGDIVLVTAGQYRERIRLKPWITVRSAGDQSRRKIGLSRAESTVLNCGGEGDNVGVGLAEESTLDGFTVTLASRYFRTVWQKHFDTQGENWRTKTVWCRKIPFPQSAFCW